MAVSAAAPETHAPETPAPKTPASQPPLTGILARIAATHTVTFGVRAHAKPFAYVLPDGKPAGLAVDLCNNLVNDISAAVGGIALKTAFKPVSAENRIERVASGAVDMECGATTRNKQRLRLVAFSPTFFISGTKLLVPLGSTIHSYRDLTDRTVAVTAGTTGEAIMHVLADRLLIRMKFVTLPDNERSFAALRQGKSDVFATDAILLSSIAASPEGQGFVLTGDYLSYDPYGLLYQRDDPAFAAVIEAGFHRLAKQRILSALYERWMMKPLPSGETLNVPMSAELTQLYRALGQPD